MHLALRNASSNSKCKHIKKIGVVKIRVLKIIETKTFAVIFDASSLIIKIYTFTGVTNVKRVAKKIQFKLTFANMKSKVVKGS